ncbi:NLI interacting factor-like phosphatase-domain-containing protein [Geopyxis carbonaria]|nr:NLI interacting factor-like phosphatase-domain-containing protein [Geopyxis carbonaria]
MNSLSIISSTVDKVIGNTPPSTPQTEPLKALRQTYRSHQFHIDSLKQSTTGGGLDQDYHSITAGSGHDSGIITDSDSETDGESPVTDARRTFTSVPTRICMIIINPWLSVIEWVVSAISGSANWLTFTDDDGSFSPLMPLKRLAGIRIQNGRIRGSGSVASFHTPGSSTSKSDEPYPNRLGSSSPKDVETSQIHGGQIAPRRSIRIRLYNEENLMHPKPSVKSPTSPSIGVNPTQYSRNSFHQVSLISRGLKAKTLILDLDETLIHSLAKGGRMTSGHMVEVKLDQQHAILYYVHKRPYCDEFLRKVCRWYNLVIFTASVQEYADPVIDWLEQDRKYFKGRYYRQHCTNRNGAFIKDIAAVEPDLSKVIIIDNSPTSYMFHEDNAIPIEGWINDPTDIDLLHLIPLLQALQYAVDVRALLALRMGE